MWPGMCVRAYITIYDLYMRSRTREKIKGGIYDVYVLEIYQIFRAYVSESLSKSYIISRLCARITI